MAESRDRSRSPVVRTAADIYKELLDRQETCHKLELERKDADHLEYSKELMNKYATEFLENSTLKSRIHELEVQFIEKDVALATLQRESRVDAVVLAGVTSAMDRQRERIESLETTQK